MAYVLIALLKQRNIQTTIMVFFLSEKIARKVRENKDTKNYSRITRKSGEGFIYIYIWLGGGDFDALGLEKGTRAGRRREDLATGETGCAGNKKDGKLVF